MDNFRVLNFVLENWEGSTPSISWVDHKCRVYLIDNGENAEFIEKLKDKPFWSNWVSSERVSNGVVSHTFLLDPRKEGFMKVSDFCRKYNTTKQKVYALPGKYEWVNESQNIRYIKYVR